MSTSLRSRIPLLLILVLSISVSRAQPSEGISAGTPDTSNVKPSEPIPQFEDFYDHLDKDPGYDIQDFYRRLKYPAMARRASIEGQVVVAVYVDETGKPVKSKIITSDSKILEGVAVDAVMTTTFTPAEINKRPVGCWMSIPVMFKLH